MDPALRSFSASLATAIRAGDQSRVQEYLRGRALPALGAHLPPSEILRQALLLAPEARSLAPGLASLLARILLDTKQALQRKRSARAGGDQLLLEDALHLAAELPAQAELFSALRKLLAATGEGFAPHRLPLWKALAYQQTDGSLESEWLALLEPSGSKEWTPERRTLLLVAWQGLLWIPPSPEEERKGQVVSLDRIEKGLLALEASVRGRDEGEDFLEEALEILQETFPRSAEFWEEQIRPRLGAWPEALREKAFHAWPGLRSFLWSSHGPAGTISLYWQSQAEHLSEESPLETLLTPATVGFWQDAGVKNSASFSRKLCSYLHSGQAIRDSLDESRRSVALLVENPADVQFFTGSLLLHQMDPQPDLVRLAAGTALACPYKDESWAQKEWRVLEAPPSLTRFAFEDLDIEHFRPKALAFQQELAHQAVAVLIQFKHFEKPLADPRAVARQIADQASGLRRALAPTAAGIEAVMAQFVQQRSMIAPVPGLQPSTALHLSFAGPTPERYLRDLAALSSALKAAALDQIRRALESAWNPLERVYLQAVATLTALQEEDFHRALQELEALRRASALTIEHQVLRLHAKAGAGDRRLSVQLFNTLEQQELADPVKKTLALLEHAYGLSGREAVPDPEQHEEIVLQEAAMIEAASSLSPAA